jgi:ABC-type Fe3+/spermidine/putrescine transport system ATPase subunit
MRVELRELQRELGIAFVHVTHNQEEALSMADRIVVMEGGHIQQVGSPAEISQRPANVFVAAFMGDNNILQGSVSEVSQDRVVLDAAVGHVAMPATGGSHQVGDKLTMAVRANCVHVAPGGTDGAPNELECTVVATEYLGDTIKVHMRAGEHSLLAKLPEQRYPELAQLAGQPVTVTWDPGDVQLLSD